MWYLCRQWHGSNDRLSWIGASDISIPLCPGRKPHNTLIRDSWNVLSWGWTERKQDQQNWIWCIFFWGGVFVAAGIASVAGYFLLTTLILQMGSHWPGQWARFQGEEHDVEVKITGCDVTTVDRISSRRVCDATLSGPPKNPWNILCIFFSRGFGKSSSRRHPAFHPCHDEEGLGSKMRNSVRWGMPLVQGSGTNGGNFGWSEKCRGCHHSVGGAWDTCCCLDFWDLTDDCVSLEFRPRQLKLLIRKKWRERWRRQLRLIADGHCLQ